MNICLKAVTFSDSLSYFRQEHRPGHFLQGVHPPTLSCSTAPSPRHQRAACSTYSTHPFSHTTSGSTFLKKRLFYFIVCFFSSSKKVYNAMKECKGLYWDCYEGKCTVWTIYNALYAFNFLFITRCFVHITICNHR